MFVKINGETHHLWRAVDHEGEVLESFVTKKRDKKAALEFLKKAMRKHDQPEEVVTDRLRSYGAALKEIGAEDQQETGRWLNNRAENSHLPFRRRERAMLRFRRMRSLQKFAAVHASVSNHINQERSLTVLAGTSSHSSDTTSQTVHFSVSLGVRLLARGYDLFQVVRFGPC